MNWDGSINSFDRIMGFRLINLLFNGFHIQGIATE